MATCPSAYSDGSVQLRQNHTGSSRSLCPEDFRPFPCCEISHKSKNRSCCAILCFCHSSCTSKNLTTKGSIESQFHGRASKLSWLYFPGSSEHGGSAVGEPDTKVPTGIHREKSACSSNYS
ncbi:hypothetical protein RvY_13908 [Ramazzottius varieornatus]|uniref:Uncharacterized protein n=1 Tax=Ramazzottius varieornatus TaxID=947166 RepID=A0A1D1VPH5_RAMVA|nr:hypothetical protein RvY_13908 [Ramazzottius varieornatus]